MAIGAFHEDAFDVQAFSEDTFLFEEAGVLIPDVVGQSQASGTAELEGEGFVVAVETAHSSIVPSGEIISQSPIAGTEAAAGSTVTITVSLGEAAETDAVSGGARFWAQYEREQARRRKKRRELEEGEEQARKLADAIEREIASHLHADLRAEEERGEVGRLRTLVARFADSDAEAAMSERVRKALARAQAQESVSAYLALDRALRQQLEEEELLVLMMLVNDD